MREVLFSGGSLKHWLHQQGVSDAAYRLLTGLPEDSRDPIHSMGNQLNTAMQMEFALSALTKIPSPHWPRLLEDQLQFCRLIRGVEKIFFSEITTRSQAELDTLVEPPLPTLGEMGDIIGWLWCPGLSSIGTRSGRISRYCWDIGHMAYDRFGINLRSKVRILSAARTLAIEILGDPKEPYSKDQWQKVLDLMGTDGFQVTLVERLGGKHPDELVADLFALARQLPPRIAAGQEGIWFVPLCYLQDIVQLGQKAGHCLKDRHQALDYLAHSRLIFRIEDDQGHCRGTLAMQKHAALDLQQENDKVFEIATINADVALPERMRGGLDVLRSLLKKGVDAQASKDDGGNGD